jgi:hypothetical protein
MVLVMPSETPLTIMYAGVNTEKRSSASPEIQIWVLFFANPEIMKPRATKKATRQKRIKRIFVTIIIELFEMIYQLLIEGIEKFMRCFYCSHTDDYFYQKVIIFFKKNICPLSNPFS